jgi:DNA-binding beta-propeller fold protein YncE
MVVLSGCSSAEYAMFSEDNASYDYGYDYGYAEEPSAPGADDGETLGEPEVEDDFLALRPAQTDVFVFVANPSRNTVTRVNVQTQEVRTAEVGQNPSVVEVTADYATAVIFNKGDDTVSILDAYSLESTAVEVRDNMNRMVISADGAWAGVWHDEDAVDPDDPPPSGLQSFNEISLVDLYDGTHYPMVVGFDPKEIQFTGDGTRAVVVSDASLAVIDLTVAPLDISLIEVAEDLIDPPPAEEVALDPEGNYAFVRQFGSSALTIVDLWTEVVDRVPLGDNLTDLDLTPDGTEAVVVARGSEQIFRFDTQDPFAIPQTLSLPEGEAFGSVSFDPTGEVGVIYTTASLSDRYATWDLATDEITLRGLVKPISSVAITPTGETLMVFHSQDDASDADVDSPFFGEWALSLIDLIDFRENPLLLPDEPSGYANANNGRYGYFIMDKVQEIEVLDFQTLLPQTIELRSDPVYVGVLPDLDLDDQDEPPAWVSQEHELGRMTFYDPDDDATETITGFELNSEIED